MTIDIKFILLVFGVIFLIVLLTRKAIRKVSKDQVTHSASAKKPAASQSNKLTEEQFHKTWKSLSFLLLLAAAGNLYMVYTAVSSALDTGLFIFWIDAVSSLAAAVAAVLIWQKRSKSMVVLYFVLTLIPIVMFMSIKFYKLNALMHLFPLVLLYFVLKPVWNNLEN
jgi:hypothetical protein